MKNIIRAEQLKMAHTFGKMLPVVAAVLNLFLALFMLAGVKNVFPAGAWNWWYGMLLPGMLAILCYLNIKKEKKIKYYNILALQVPVEKSWVGKIICISLSLLLANLIIFAGTLIGGAILGTTITPLGGICGAILLTISYLWEIPLFLFLSAKFGMFVSIFSSMVLSVTGVVTLADSDLWWSYPASIPIRLMCPVLGILPNGLLVPADSELNNMNVVFPGVLLSILWFIVLTVLTSIWIRNMEEK